MSDADRLREAENVAEPTPTPRLTRVAPWLWINLDDVVSIQTATEKSTYHRTVTITTRSAGRHKIIVVPGGKHRTVGPADAELAAWMAERFGGLLEVDR